MFRHVMFAVVCAGVLIIPIAQAQSSATLILQSGERVSGDLIDFGGHGFTIRVGGRQRQVPANAVAVVEFQSGGDLSNEWRAKLKSGQPLVVLRSGQIIEGRLRDIAGGGETALRLTIETSSGQRDITADEVAQVYFALPPAPAVSPVAVGTSGTATTPLEPGAFSVPANQHWTPTGITVKNGETLHIRATGVIRLSPDPNDRAYVAGALNPRSANGAPLPAVSAGALIGRIGPEGQPFAIGDQTSVSMPVSGMLYLGINDDEVSDNTGNFAVVISKR